MKLDDKPTLAFQEHHFFFAHYVNELSIHVLTGDLFQAGHRT